ncbi:unnamed protein product [Rhodiola kirilowii]
MAANTESTIDGSENSGARSHLDMYKPKRPINDVESPFYLHPSDHPGLSICPVTLKGDNYEEWTIAMKNAFCAKRKMGFLNGRISKPTDPDDEDDWYSVNSMLIGWIIQSIDPALRSSITYSSTVRELWSDLQQQFSVGNGPRILQIRSDIAQCRQQGQGVSVYFGKLKKLWDELVTYVPPRSCSCGNCTCQISSHLSREREEERLHQFLMGLDDDPFSTLRSNIMAQDPLPTIKRAYALVIQEERHKTVIKSREPHTDAVAFAVQQPSTEPSHNNTHKLQCTHCGKNGHAVTTCYRIHGYPEGSTPRLRKPSDMSTDKNIGRDSGPVARSAAGRGRWRGSGRANAAQQHVQHPSHTGFQPDAQDRATLGNAIQPDQWQSIMNLFASLNNNSGSSTQSAGMFSNWILDSGASFHMTGDKSLLRDITPISPVSIKLPDNNFAAAAEAGTFTITGSVSLQHVLFIPNLGCNLISLAQLLADSQCFALLTDRLCVIQDRNTRTVIGVGEQRGGVYWLRNFQSASGYCSASSVNSASLWHQRLGHPSSSVLSSLSSSGQIVSHQKSPDPCDICFQAKQTRCAFPLSYNKADGLFHLIHCDIWGPYSVPSHTGASYFLTILDDYSRATWVYLLSSKSEVALLIKNFCAMTQTQFHKKVRRVRSDNGMEFVSLQQFFATQGIIAETTCIYTPQQNGRVERKHRHILNVARALHFQASLPIQFWGECVLTACYLINRTPTPLLDNKSPFQLLFGHAPSYSHLRVFGCLCYASVIPRSRDKFVARSTKCIFMGYPIGKRGWRLYDLETRQLFVSRDVIFYEHIFPWATYENTTTQSPQVLSPAAYDLPDIEATSQPITVRGSSTTITDGQIPSDSDAVAAINADTVVELRRSTRSRQPSVLLRDFVCNTVLPFENPTSAALTAPASSSSGISYPIAAYVSCARFSGPHANFLAAVTANHEPVTYKEAVKYAHWRAAMQNELDALEKNGTWEPSLLPPEKKAIGCKWVFRIKYHSNGTIERYKARLVVLGNKQVEGIDFTETFAPVAKMSTVRVLLSVAAVKGWELHQMDVHNAFLHGDLNEEVYMRPPQGYSAIPSGYVCKLRKSLYGLRQAPRNWFSKLAAALRTFGFVQSLADYSLFSITQRDNKVLHVLVYVDDLIISGNDAIFISTFKTYLSSCFHMKDLGVLKYFLGLEIARNSTGIFVSQRKYALEIIAESGLLGSKPCEFPMDSHHQLASVEGPDLDNPERYRRLIGRLVYLTITRPELCYAVHTLSQFMQSPKEPHWLAAIRVVRYLKGHPGQGLHLSQESALQLTAYCDSDWASCPLTRRSVTGYFLTLGCSPISWKTKKQVTVSRSSAEAEYRSMASTCSEIIWLRSLLRSLGIEHHSPVRLLCDSQAALHIASNPVFHERTKHIEVDCHFVRDLVVAGTIELSHVSTLQQPADIFTKALGKAQFHHLMGKLGIIDLHAPT